MNIGGLEKTSGVSAKLIRHYESIGLIPKARRTSSGYRIYNEKDVQFIRFIKRARSLGFSIQEIKALISLWKNKARASKEVKVLALAHVEKMEDKIIAMQEIVQNLRSLAQTCHGDSRPDCPIIADLEGC